LVQDVRAIRAKMQVWQDVQAVKVLDERLREMGFLGELDDRIADLLTRNRARRDEDTT